MQSHTFVTLPLKCYNSKICVKNHTLSFMTDTSSSARMKELSDVPGILFWIESHNLNNCWSNTYLVSVGLPGQNPACTTSFRDQDGMILLQLEHWIVSLFKSYRPEIENIQFINIDSHCTLAFKYSLVKWFQLGIPITINHIGETYYLIKWISYYDTFESNYLP